MLCFVNTINWHVLVPGREEPIFHDVYRTDCKYHTPLHSPTVHGVHAFFNFVSLFGLGQIDDSSVELESPGMIMEKKAEVCK